jgi:RNA polymerase sigma-70 factor (ECF subfamily)
LLQQQDRSRWDRDAIDRAIRLIKRAAALRRPGPFLIETSIAALHCEASSWEETDWPQVVELYGLLMRFDPSPVVALNRAIARSWSEGPGVALADVEELAPQLGGYHLFHAARAALLRRLGRDEEADAHDDQAIQLTRNVAERSLMSERLDRAGEARLLA